MEGATVAVAAASAFACGAAWVSMLPASDDEIEEAIRASMCVAEPTAEHRISILLLPGFTAKSGKPLMQWFQRVQGYGISLQHVRLVAFAPPVRNITCYDGWSTNAWFDYIDEQFDVEDIIDVAQLAQCRRILSKVVHEEAKLVQGAKNLIVLGFSQGGNVAYDIALGHCERLGGLIARRTSLRNESSLGTHKSLPILHFHGTEDDSIGCCRGESGITRLRAAGFTDVILQVERGLNHVDFSDKEMNTIADFLCSLFLCIKS